MDELLYWLIEYAKVLFGYGFLMFVWPSAVFRKFLKGKSLTFRFSFCVTAQVVIINTMVLVLGLFHILNKWTMWIVFYGILIWSFRDKLKITKEMRNKFKYLITGTYGIKHFALRCWQKFKRGVKLVWRTFWDVYRKHWLEYTLLLATLIYGMIYFSYGAFQDYSYGFGDMYVHHSWVYGLVQGQIFSAGVYPEAMHCIIYAMHTILGINIYSCMLFLAGIHIAIILLAAYCLMKEIFAWRYSAIFVLILFLTVDVVVVNEIFSMSRLQWTLPQEYGFHTMYICALYLILYLKNKKTAVFRGKETKGYWDENLLIFMLAIAASIAIHFYSTIMAFFICVAFAVFNLRKIFNRKRFVPLITAALCGLLIAAAPMGGALLSGIPFQGSIGWALGVIGGSEDDSIENIGSEQETPSTQPETGTGDSAPESPGVTDTPNNQPESITPKPDTSPEIPKESMVQKLENIGKQLLKTLDEKRHGIYVYGYKTLYGEERSQWILNISALVCVLYIAYKVITFILRKLFRLKKVTGKTFVGYLPIVLASAIFIMMYAAPNIGIPELVAGARLCTMAQMLILFVMVMPIDMLFTLIGKILPNVLMQLLSAATAVGIIYVIWTAGYYHGYLYYELTRYNAAVSLTNRIMEELPQFSYTIVSPTDETYQLIQDGRHEELIDFLKPKGEKRYTIPTEYIFIFIEKKPMQYAHSHFFSGPDWLALEKYQKHYTSFGGSLCPHITAREISEEAANRGLMYFSKPSQSYSNFDSRVIVESKAYKWCQDFKELYPNELKTYYEDEDFVCYYFRQNPNFLYDLNLGY